jgi:hypothetical protein
MWHAVSLSILTIAAANCCCASQPALVLGASPASCRSALRIGVVTCDSGTNDSDEPWSVSEAQIDEYLAQYGKPPREAVRALLDPSDRNIAAWLRKQHEIIATASYVASRMTEIAAESNSLRTVDYSVPSSQFPAMMQMRATLFFKFESSPSWRAVHALQTVVDHYPSIEGRLVHVGPLPDARRSKWLAALGTVLPLSTVPGETINNLSVPSLLIEDLRYMTRQLLDATDLTAERVHEQIVALRTAGQTHDRNLIITTPLKQ